MDDKKIEILNNVICYNTEKKIPFPQADSFETIIGVISMVSMGNTTAQKISDFWGYNVRQGNYYLAAALYLNLVNESQNGEYVLSELGQKCTNVNERKRNQLLIEEILKHRAFNIAYRLFLASDKNPEKKDITKILCMETGLSETTANRRAGTVIRWLNWIDKVII